MGKELVDNRISFLQNKIHSSSSVWLSFSNSPYHPNFPLCRPAEGVLRFYTC